MSKPDLVIGLDIGTTSTVGLLMRPSGDVIHHTSRDVDLVSRHPGWAEEDPQQWWDNSCAILSEIAEAAEPSRIAGICVTGMLPALVSGRCMARTATRLADRVLLQGTLQCSVYIPSGIRIAV